MPQPPPGTGWFCPTEPGRWPAPPRAPLSARGQRGTDVTVHHAAAARSILLAHCVTQHVEAPGPHTHALPNSPTRGERKREKKKKKKKKREKEREKKKGSNLSFESFSLKCSHGFIRICSHRGFEEPGIRSETSGKIRINENIIPKTKGKINPALPLVCSTAFPQLVTLNLLNRLELSFPFSLSLPY